MAAVVDGYRQPVRYIVAKGCHRAVVIGAAPFPEQIGEPINQHFCARFLRVTEEQVLPCFFAIAVGVVENRLCGGRKHNGTPIAVLFQSFQKFRGKTEIALCKFRFVLRTVNARKVENKIATVTEII